MVVVVAEARRKQQLPQRLHAAPATLLPPPPVRAPAPLVGRIPMEDVICYRCGGTGHMVRTCPLPAPAPGRGRGGGRGGRCRGRAFLAPVAAREGLQGTVIYAGLPCKVLFDTGASHSFIFRYFCMSRGIETTRVAHLLSVGTPMGVSVDLTEVVRKYEI